MLARDREHIGLPALFQPSPQLAVVAVDLIADDPRGGNPRAERPCKHLDSQLWLRCEGHVGGDPRAFTSCAVLDPGLGEVQGTIEKGAPAGRGVGKEDAYLTVLDAPSGAAVLALHPGRMRTFLQKTRLID